MLGKERKKKKSWNPSLQQQLFAELTAIPHPNPLHFLLFYSSLSSDITDPLILLPCWPPATTLSCLLPLVSLTLLCLISFKTADFIFSDLATALVKLLPVCLCHWDPLQHRAYIMLLAHIRLDNANTQMYMWMSAKHLFVQFVLWTQLQDFILIPGKFAFCPFLFWVSSLWWPHIEMSSYTKS